MSWHFSQALVAAYSGDTCSAGAQSARSSGSPTPALYCAPDRMKVFSRLSRFGMTCEPLTDDLGAAVLTWCLEASPAKTLVQPEKAQESTERDQECGEKWRASFTKYDPDLRSWKTHQCLLLGDLEPFSETWPQWGLMHAGECSEQLMPAHLIKETVSGSWPTPNCVGFRSDGEISILARTLTNYEEFRAMTSHAAASKRNRYWPTPTQGMWKQDVNDNGEYAQRVLESGFQVMLPAAVKMWPTPTAHNAKETNAPSESERNTPTLAAQAGGSLNPTWVEKLMGWPKNWTSLHPMIDSDYVSWIMGFCEHEKIRTNHTLQMLRRTPYAQNFQRTTGRSFGIQEAQVLLSELRQHPEGFDEAWIQLASEEAPEAEVRSVRPSASFASAPSGSADNKQPPREHSDAMQKLPRLLAHDGKEAWADSRWENAIPRTAVAVPARVDRLKAIGNGQVPAVAALAWRILTQ